MEDTMPDLLAHMKEQRIEIHMFASQWFLTLFATKVSISWNDCGRLRACLLPSVDVHCRANCRPLVFLSTHVQFSLTLVFRIFDFFLAEGFNTIFQISLALLKTFKKGKGAGRTESTVPFFFLFPCYMRPISCPPLSQRSCPRPLRRFWAFSAWRCLMPAAMSAAPTI